MRNIRISYPSKYILLFDGNSSGSFIHVKMPLQVVVAHTYSVDQTLCMPVGSVFDDNVSTHEW